MDGVIFVLNVLACKRQQCPLRPWL